MPSPFIWYELMTGDPAAAVDFYCKVVGWTPEKWPGENMDYTVLKVGETGVAGVMATPAEAQSNGAPPAWVGYVHVSDVDAEATAIAEAGGTVLRPPADIPGVGRFAVVADPHRAVFMVMAPQGRDTPPPPAPDTPGLVGWRELLCGDLEEALRFYEKRFGWTRGEAFDMGEMGIYQLVDTGGGQGAGLMTKPPHIPEAYWGFYFNVEALDAGVERLTAAGGRVVFDPMEVPGGQWVVNAVDPQGAYFSLVANHR